MQRPDFSDYVAHFTKDAAPFGAGKHPTDAAIKVAKGSAYERLISILTSKRVRATPMPWTDRKATAFTECPWGSLLAHTRHYSPFGLGFTKAHLFAAGGGPAIYLRPHMHTNQMQFKWGEMKGFHPELYAFITPFCPPYAPRKYKEKFWKDRPPVDYSHEREWRVPDDFTFELSEIQFVIVPDYDTVAKFPKPLKDAIGRKKFIMIDVYSQIEKLWPVHII
jgi:hypothetical protein